MAFRSRTAMARRARGRDKLPRCVRLGGWEPMVFKSAMRRYQQEGTEESAVEGAWEGARSC